MHPLLINSTAGHSDKNTRMSVVSCYTSTETPVSSQERSLGYRTLAVGPMNEILRLIGNDNLTPFRTYGGYAGIVRRFQDIYDFSDYRIDHHCLQYLKDFDKP